MFLHIYIQSLILLENWLISDIGPISISDLQILNLIKICRRKMQLGLEKKNVICSPRVWKKETSLWFTFFSSYRVTHVVKCHRKNSIFSFHRRRWHFGGRSLRSRGVPRLGSRDPDRSDRVSPLVEQIVRTCGLTAITTEINAESQLPRIDYPAPVRFDACFRECRVRKLRHDPTCCRGVFWNVFSPILNN